MNDFEVIVIDYHKGNIRSVEKALSMCGCTVRVTDRAEDIEHAPALVLPGVGAFRDASTTLTDLGLVSAIKRYIASERPFLGICLGLHLLFEGGVEHAEGSPIPGLGIIEGIVDRMPDTSQTGEKFKVPHVGWNGIEKTKLGDASPLFQHTSENERFYFTHSYMAPPSEYTIANATHSVTFPCAVQKGSAFGVQFHPEKSSDAGLALLECFVGFAKHYE